MSTTTASFYYSIATIVTVYSRSRVLAFRWYDEGLRFGQPDSFRFWCIKNSAVA